MGERVEAYLPTRTKLLGSVGRIVKSEGSARVLNIESKRREVRSRAYIINSAISFFRRQSYCKITMSGRFQNRTESGIDNHFRFFWRNVASAYKTLSPRQRWNTWLKKLNAF